jgi:hypothetical protein
MQLHHQPQHHQHHNHQLDHLQDRQVPGQELLVGQGGGGPSVNMPRRKTKPIMEEELTSMQVSE